MSSLRTRIAALVFLIVLGAVGLISLWVLPTLEPALRRQTLDELATAARRQAPGAQRALAREAPADELARLARSAAGAVAGRVTLLGLAQTPDGLRPFVKADSAPQEGAGELQFPAALDAARSRSERTAVEAADDARVGQAAIPLLTGDRSRVEAVLVVSRPLGDTGAAVELVARRVLAAGLIALLLALAASGLLAHRLVRRVAGLEQVARGVAGGDFDAHFPTGDDDELGSLARELERMRSQLAELETARRRFIATASHELRTPLFSLGGFVELLEDEDVDEADRRRFTAQLRDQVMRLQRLATSLLDLSRIDAGALELVESDSDLRGIARQVATEFEPLAASKSAHIELRLPARPLIARCDPERIAQLLRILVDNALAHTPDGTDVVIAASRRDDTFRIGVADYGPGISRSLLPTIFEPFTTSDDVQGTGLGLAIASELATHMNGELRADSRPGLTTFTLVLPVPEP